MDIVVFFSFLVLISSSVIVSFSSLSEDGIRMDNRGSRCEVVVGIVACVSGIWVISSDESASSPSCVALFGVVSCSF